MSIRIKSYALVVFAGFALGTAPLSAADRIESVFSISAVAAPHPSGSTAGAAVGASRTLQLLQDQVAEGSRQAFSAQKVLIGGINDRMKLLAPASWAESANIDAAVVFSLSGGSPDVLRSIVGKGTLSQDKRHMVHASLAFLEGRKAEALRHLAEVDVESLGVTLRANLNFMHASLLIDKAPAKAMGLLDRVRLEVPGTLLEEASLRRQLIVARELNDFSKFSYIAREYVRRFPNSIYAGNFRQRLEAGLLKFDFADKHENFAEMSEMLSYLDPASQRSMYLAAARILVEEGRVKSALPIAEEAKKLSASAPSDLARANLYLGASRIVSPDSLAMGMKILSEVDRSVLSEKDTHLLDSAKAVGANIGKAAKLPDAQATAGYAEGVENPEDEHVSAIVKQANNALSAVDSILQR